MESNYLSEASKLVSNKKFEEAKLILDNMTKNEDNLEAIKLLGLCYVNLNETQNAISTFQKAVQIDSKDATSWYYLASLYDNLNDEEKAEQAYLKVLKLREEYADARKNLTLLYIKLKKFDKAKELAIKTTELEPEDYQGYYILGTIHIALGDKKEGIKNLEKANELEPENSSVLSSLGIAYFSANRLDLALNMLNIADELDPHNPVINYNLGNIYQIKKDHQTAFKHFQIAYTSDPTSLHLSALAYSALKAEKYEDAIVLYKTLILICPDKQNFQYNLACAYIQTNKIKEAIPILKKLVAQNPKSSAMAEKLADIYVSLGDYNDAKLIYDLLIRKGKITANTYYKYALICMKSNDKDKALQTLKKVISLEPENAIAHKDLGVIYLSQRLFDYAKEEFELAIKYAPDSPIIIFAYANYLYATADYIGAKPLYKKVCLQKPNDAQHWFYKGLNHLALNELDDAKIAFTSSIYVEKNDVNTFHLARVNFHLHNFSEAKKQLESLETQDVDAQNLMALTAYELGEYDTSIDIYKKLLEKFEENINIMLSLAKCYIQKKDKKEAIKAINETLKRFPEHEEATTLLKEAEEL